jgi:hypothetical protein
MVGGQSRQIVCKTLAPKITRTKWTGGVVQAVERLLCKCEALSSNSSLTKKKKKYIYIYIYISFNHHNNLSNKEKVLIIIDYHLPLEELDSDKWMKIIFLITEDFSASLGFAPALDPRPIRQILQIWIEVICCSLVAAQAGAESKCRRAQHLLYLLLH